MYCCARRRNSSWTSGTRRLSASSSPRFHARSSSVGVVTPHSMPLLAGLFRLLLYEHPPRSHDPARADEPRNERTAMTSGFLAVSLALAQIAVSFSGLQTTATTSFDVASIRPNTTGDTGWLLAPPQRGRERIVNLELRKIIASSFRT